MVDNNQEDKEKQEEIIVNKVDQESEKIENVTAIKQTEETINDSTGKLIFMFINF